MFPRESYVAAEWKEAYLNIVVNRNGRLWNNLDELSAPIWATWFYVDLKGVCHSACIFLACSSALCVGYAHVARALRVPVKKPCTRASRLTSEDRRRVRCMRAESANSC